MNRETRERLKRQADEQRAMNCLAEQRGESPVAVAPELRPAKTPGTPARDGGAIIGHEDVIAKCGHPERIDLIAGKEKFLQARREKILKRACGPCRQEAHNAKVAAEQAAKAAKPRPVANPPGHKMRNLGRLPHGSTFTVRYDAELEMWIGELTIQEKVFHGSNTGVFYLLRGLDTQYREWKAGEKIPG
jgi:hypothetical protein